MLTAESCVSSHLAVVDPHADELDDRFAFYFLQTVRAQDLIGDQSYPSLNLTHIEGIEFSIPSLAEQKRIVAKLDGVSGEVSLLEQALRIEASGTGDLRRSIIDSIMRGVDAPRLRLDEVFVMFADGDWIESKDQSASGIRLVQTGNVGDGQFKDRRDKVRWIDQATFDRLKCTEIFPGDILFSRLPDPVGRACLLPDTGDRMITAVDCTIARTKKDLMLPEFIVLYASSTDYYSQVGSMITGTTRDRISRKNLGAVTVPVPGLAQQRAIIAQVAELDADCAALRANIERRIAVAADLRQSVLEAAFRGEL
jgi:restriction endonuclease S subunit